VSIAEEVLMLRSRNISLSFIGTRPLVGQLQGDWVDERGGSKISNATK
jgi:hypothetical protein